MSGKAGKEPVVKGWYGELTLPLLLLLVFYIDVKSSLSVKILTR